ncbi:hypothetical protein [Aestuariivirga litoralis]|uniref:hypothetical protein n=1 Tax=Aestuariivirga litoralis TaxID=2650924 RepID=UPI0018C7EFCE|nr:hypothetical protein [Aestuariivirga litoralis]MBG1233464.1 hypothetical protein [Aestuariivirga litoralis]
MSLLLFKLIVPPVLIVIASLAGRRWGDAVGGWFVGLPLTSGPVAIFLAIQHGADFAAVASNGSLIGTAGQAWFGLAYALVAQLGWGVALFAGSVAYAIWALLMTFAPFSHLGYFAIALATLTVVARFIPHRSVERSSLPPPWWDLPARMIIVIVQVLSLTASAQFTGAKLTGALASFPVFGAILTVFAHRLQGDEMARQVLRGLVLALYGFATFFFITGLALPKLGIVLAFSLAIAATLVVQGVALKFIRA